MELNSCDVKGFVNSDEFNQCGIEEGIITQQLFDLLLEHTVHGLANLVQDLVAVVDLKKIVKVAGRQFRCIPLYWDINLAAPGPTRQSFEDQ